ncbi:MAG TPA: hypothetical protein PKC62_05390 [Ferruginibacter sp.]|nr:hypothetical protein [Bacteroidota bacterium]MBS1924691.1 hypothetical protein [Bacteroidota bacterium]MCC6691951.1 hypothetical protein [Chitinophagaceae bacterium]HMT96101.1 hypothetical protein [Ferruginibacter sp.]HMU23655.1 hypothetical protein [Ferruginibacter sp.]
MLPFSIYSETFDKTKSYSLKILFVIKCSGGSVSWMQWLLEQLGTGEFSCGSAFGLL